MADAFTYKSINRLELKNKQRNAYMGEIEEPVVYGVQGALREHYGVTEGTARSLHARSHCRRSRWLNVRHASRGASSTQSEVRS